MKIKKKIIQLINSGVALLLFSSSLAIAQTPVQVRRVDLSVPFGVAAGKLVLINDNLIFLDDAMPDASFSIAKNSIRNLSEQNASITIETVIPIRDRSGERSSFTFRLIDKEPLALTDWVKTEKPATVATSANSVEKEKASLLFEAEHDHSLFRGSCQGRLVVTDRMLSFESLSDINHSRQWLFVDIKKLKRISPYRLEVEPFSGDKYEFDLRGKGMDIEDYKRLENSVAAARAQR